MFLLPSEGLVYFCELNKLNLIFNLNLWHIHGFHAQVENIHYCCMELGIMIDENIELLRN